MDPPSGGAVEVLLLERRPDLDGVFVASDLMASGAPEDAVDVLAYAAELRDGADVHRLRACACLLQSDFQSALEEYMAAIG